MFPLASCLGTTVLLSSCHPVFSGGCLEVTLEGITICLWGHGGGQQDVHQVSLWHAHHNGFLFWRPCMDQLLEEQSVRAILTAPAVVGQARRNTLQLNVVGPTGATIGGFWKGWACTTKKMRSDVKHTVRPGMLHDVPASIGSSRAM